MAFPDLSRPFPAPLATPGPKPDMSGRTGSHTAEDASATGHPLLPYRATSYYGVNMDERRDQVIAVRLTATDVAQIDHQADTEGRDRSGMIRWMIQRYLQGDER